MQNCTENFIFPHVALGHFYAMECVKYFITLHMYIQTPDTGPAKHTDLPDVKEDDKGQFIIFTCCSVHVHL